MTMVDVSGVGILRVGCGQMADNPRDALGGGRLQAGSSSPV